MYTKKKIQTQEKCTFGKNSDLEKNAHQKWAQKKTQKKNLDLSKNSSTNCFVLNIKIYYLKQVKMPIPKSYYEKIYLLTSQDQWVMIQKASSCKKDNRIIYHAINVKRKYF